jgi:hypothetical protein
VSKPDAAEIEDDAILAVAAEHLVVKHRQERSPLAARSDIAAAEIRHHVKAGDLGEGIRIADLPGKRNRDVRPMAQRLPVTPDGAHGLGTHARAVHQLQRAAGEGLCHRDVDLTDLIQGHALRSIDEGGNPALESRLEGLGARRNQRQR